MKPLLIDVLEPTYNFYFYSPLFFIAMFFIGNIALIDIFMNRFKKGKSKYYWTILILLSLGFGGVIYFFKRKALILKK